MLKIIFSLIFLICTSILIFPQETNTPFLQKCWQFPLENYNPKLIASDNKAELIFLSTKENITVINSKGELFWKTDLLNEEIQDLLIEKEKLFILTTFNTNNRYYIRNISIQTGLIKDKIEVELQDNEKIIGLFQIDKELHLLSSFGTLRKFIIGDDKFIEEETTKLKNFLETKLLIQNDEIYFISDQNKLVKFNIKNKNEEIIKINISQKIEKVFNFDKTIILTTNSGKIFNINKINFEIRWSYQTGASVLNIEQIENKLLLFSSDNFIYNINIENGNVIWKYKNLAKPHGAINLLDKKIISSNLNESAAVVLSFEGKLKYQLNLEEENNFFISKPIIFSYKYIFFTNFGLLAYSQSKC